MDALTFVSNVISSVVWPATVIMAIIVLRNPLRALIRNLGRRLHSVKFPGGEAEFSQELAEVKQAADEAQLPAAKFEPTEEHMLLQEEEDKQHWVRLAKISPRSAIVEAWRNVENAIVEVARKADIPKEETHSTMALIRALVKRQVISPDVLPIISELRSIRNTAVHGVDFNISQPDVEQYLSIANRVVTKLRG